jgi:hypothetical protein
MNFFYLLKIFALSSTIELGFIPGHDMSLFEIPDYQLHINIAQTYYFDYHAELDITKYAFIEGGITSFSIPYTGDASFYPIRVDYDLGAGLRYKCLEAGWRHGCFHPIAPNVSNMPLPKIDAHQDAFYIKATIGKPLH